MQNPSKAMRLNKTHLLVLKLDYKKNEVSLFVDQP